MSLTSHIMVVHFDTRKAHLTLSSASTDKLSTGGKNKVYCDICGKTCDCKSYLMRHIMAVHFGVKEIQGRNHFYCDICEKIFIRKTFLISHIMAVHFGVKEIQVINNFYCDICEKIFIRKTFLISHIMDVHFGIREFQCKMCPASFVNDYRLRRHSNIHKNI